MGNTEKQAEYASKLISHIKEIFNEDCEYHINPEELTDENNATNFFHALATLAPAHLYMKLTKTEIDLLEFNYICNRLCFQYLNLQG